MPANLTMSRTLNQTSRIMDMRPGHFNTLCMILDPDGSWKDLAATIKDRRGCPMLGNDQVLNIEHTPASPTRQVLECWSTSNPTLLDLRDALLSMGHLRAANHVNVEVLNKPQIVGDQLFDAHGGRVHKHTSGNGFHRDTGSANFQQNFHLQNSQASGDPKLPNAQEDCRVQFEIPPDHMSSASYEETLRKRPSEQYESEMSNSQPTTSIRSDMEEPKSDSMAGVHRFDLSELMDLTNKFDEKPVHDGGHLLGQGGFGKVYKGQRDGHFSVAVKCFDSEVICNDEALARKQFITEIDTLVKCSHTNILRLIGYCVDIHWCIVYEYMSNGSLEDRLACLGGTPPLSVACRLSIAQGVAHGIDYFHRQFTPALVHRDIKSANVLLDKNFIAKIGDCGTVRLGPRDPKATHTMIVSGVIGTQAYMPPEYLENGDVSPKLDAYSYGVVLLEIITGLKPSDSNREEKLLPTHVREMVDDEEEKILTMVDNNARPWRDDLVLAIYRTSKKLMEHHKRRATVSEMLSEIDSWSEDSSDS